MVFLRRFFRWLGARIDARPVWARAIVFLAIVGLNVAGWMRFRDERRPSFALDRAADAVRDHDSAAFESAADVDAIAGSYYDQHLLPQRLANHTADITGVRALDVTSIARRLRRWIETERLDENERPRLRLIGDFVRSALRRHPRIRRIVAARNTAIVTVDLSDENRVTVPFEIKVVRQQGLWHINEITNVEQICGALRSSEIGRIRAAARTIDTLLRTDTPRRTAAGRNDFIVPLVATAPVAVTYSVICRPALGQGSFSSGLARTFQKPGRFSLGVTCTCAGECPPPTISIDSVRELQSNRVTRRELPRPLD